LKATLVAPVKFVPVKVTAAPTSPLAGEKLVNVGLATLTVKLLAEVAVPCGVTSEIFPVTAALGTVRVALVALLTEKVAETPPIVTEVAPIKFVPVRVTEVPTAPLVGLKVAIVGDGFGGGGVWLTLPLPHPEESAVVNTKQASPSAGWNPLALSFFLLRISSRRPKNIAPNLRTSFEVSAWAVDADRRIVPRQVLHNLPE